MNIFKKIILIKSFFSGASPNTIAAILNVPLSKVDDWANGRDSPSKDQAQHIKKINSPLARLKRVVLHRLTLCFKKYFLLLHKKEFFDINTHTLG